MSFATASCDLWQNEQRKTSSDPDRFFTFGLKSIPQPFLGFYQWGWRVFLFGVVLGLCLLLSKP